jgi:hypothetical protein
MRASNPGQGPYTCALVKTQRRAPAPRRGRAERRPRALPCRVHTGVCQGRFIQLWPSGCTAHGGGCCGCWPHIPACSCVFHYGQHQLCNVTGRWGVRAAGTALKWESRQSPPLRLRGMGCTRGSARCGREAGACCCTHTRGVCVPRTYVYSPSGLSFLWVVGVGARAARLASSDSTGPQCTRQ